MLRASRLPSAHGGDADNVPYAKYARDDASARDDVSAARAGGIRACSSWLQSTLFMTTIMVIHKMKSANIP